MAMQDVRWKTIVERRQTPIYMDTLIRGQKAPFLSKALGFRYELRNIKRMGLPLCVDEEEIANLRVRIRCHPEGLNYFKAFAERCYNQCDEFISKSIAIGTRITGTSRLVATDAWAAMAQHLEDAYHVTAYLIAVVAADFVLQELLAEALAACTHLSADDRAKLRPALLISSRPTHEIEALRELEQISIQIENRMSTGCTAASQVATALQSLDLCRPQTVVFLRKTIESQWPDLQQTIESFTTKYGWTGTLFYRGDLLSWEQVAERLKIMLNGFCCSRLREVQMRHQLAEDSYRKAVDELRLSGASLDLLSVIRTFLHLRSHRLDTLFIAQSLARPVFESLARTIGTTYDDLLFMTIDEIHTACRGDGLPVPTSISDRKINYGVLMLDGRVSWYTGRDLAAVQPTGPNTEDTTEIRGIVACTGHATGTAKIVIDLADMHNVRERDVLVTTMTLPAMMPAIQHSIAIVTKEGGMLCHAAIVSRELNKPCIIGVGPSIEQIRNGDLIEVNATEGWVRILKTAESNKSDSHL